MGKWNSKIKQLRPRWKLRCENLKPRLKWTIKPYRTILHNFIQWTKRNGINIIVFGQHGTKDCFLSSLVVHTKAKWQKLGPTWVKQHHLFEWMSGIEKSWNVNPNPTFQMSHQVAILLQNYSTIQMNYPTVEANFTMPTTIIFSFYFSVPAAKSVFASLFLIQGC